MLAWMRENHPVDPSKIGITGSSQGGIHSWMAVAHGMGVAAAARQNFTADVSRAILINGGINRRAIISRRSSVDYLPSTIKLRRDAVVEYDAARIGAQAATRDLRELLRGATIPVMVQFAFEDEWGMANNVIDDYLALGGPKKLYLGTGGHGSANVPSERRFGQHWINRWFDRWLKDERNGIEGEHPVTVAMLDTWRHLSLPAFPPPTVRMTQYNLEGDGRTGGGLARENGADRGAQRLQPGDAEAVSPERPLARQSLEHRSGADFGLAEFYDAGGPLGGPLGALARFRLDSLRYSTPKLEHDLVLAGIPKIQIAFHGTARMHQVALRLWAIDGSSGRRRLISRVSATSDRGDGDGQHVRIEMSATAYRVLAGGSVELEISNLDLDWDAAKQDWRSLWAIPVFEPGEIAVHSGERPFAFLKLPELRDPDEA